MRAYDSDRTILCCPGCGRIDRFTQAPRVSSWHYICVCGHEVTNQQDLMTKAIHAGTLGPLLDQDTWPPADAT